jgi:hypothetical protein
MVQRYLSAIPARGKSIALRPSYRKWNTGKI